MIYIEDDWAAEVEVLAIAVTDDWVIYKLRVIKTIQASKIYEPVDIDTVMEVGYKLGCKHCAGWRLIANELHEFYPSTQFSDLCECCGKGFEADIHA